MMRAAIVAGVMMAAGAAWAQAPDWTAVDECYRRSAADLDDMSSDAETIAGAVSFSCMTAERKLVAYAKPGNEQERTQAHLDMRSTFLARATTAVLVRRVMIRKGEMKP
ncbi:MAG: hypothetical protein J0I54_17775 [Bosea sp.]|uniref:hypothetical protein n=1 Tax=unclassified Bosea (in: a-proteobacteria) TaxID=2653178 RepID=UPI000966EE9F|nr:MULTISPECIES: hypothetical protein [unclassified Bosea (in: a-proteobacteria)]MBN9458483.1 hypothetical protein [Bosea sp. (in: a-proteobacteria)]OJV06815.1 MAG: hypothetical protein BGO20_00170 [Bosea sp. 67-29]